MRGGDSITLILEFSEIISIKSGQFQFNTFILDILSQTLNL